MGLDISVGILAELRDMDEEEACRDYRKEFTAINQALHAAGLPEHQEPENITRYFSCEMYGYGGLHYLRRIAAYLGKGESLPQPGDDKAADDPVLRECYVPKGDYEPGRFDHLIHHSDCEGFYLPLDFSNVLYPAAALKIPGGMIGSSYRLQEECLRLAQALELPLDLDPESEEVWDVIDSLDKADLVWQQYAIESFTCLQLLRACEASRQTGCAIVFC